MTVFRKLENQRFPEGAVISIECELSRHNVDVKWMKVSVWFFYLFFTGNICDTDKRPQKKKKTP